MKLLSKGLFALILFGAWALAFLIAGWLIAAFAIGGLGLSTDYEFPIMGVMLLLCIVTYTFLLNFLLSKVAR